MIGFAKHIVKRVLPAPAWERFRNRWWRYVRPLTIDYCPIPLPWFPSARPATAVARLHRLALSFQWHEDPSVVTTACTWVAAVSWPLRFAADTARCGWRYGGAVTRTYGVGRLRQLADILRHGVARNVSPGSYYAFRLFQPENGRRARAYLQPSEMDILHPALMAGRPPDTELRLKQVFFEHARAQGLPVADSIALFAGGVARRWYGGAEGVLPASDLVLKPVDLACGRGVQIWTHDDADGSWRRGELALDRAAFIAHCGDTASHHAHLLQPRLANHPALAAVSGQALSTIRVVTWRRPSGEQGVLLACLRMGTGRSAVDNFEAGGIAAPIDLATGRLQKAVAKDPARGAFTHHPDTGAPIEGLAVPLLADALLTTLQAHAAFPWVPFVGWDVVVTAGGPLLLEANPDFCVELAQISTGTPLGDTVYPQVFLEYLQHAAGAPATLAS